jgi:IS5 family transposase
MKETIFAVSGFEIATKKTRKRIFLEEMTAVVPWASLVGIIPGHAPVAESFRPPFPTETMLQFRHFLEEFGLSKNILAEANAILQFRGILLRSGTAIDAMLIAVPSSSRIFDSLCILGRRPHAF